MDVCGLFIGDTTMTYGSLRSTLYRDYEKFPYGTFENNKNPTIKDYYSKVQEKCQQVKEQQKKGKQSCPFCRENKKRPLINYMRKREVHKHKDSICEEDEEEQEECEETEQHEHQEEHNHEAHAQSSHSENHGVLKKSDQNEKHN